jgi:hypothetical protein
MQRTTKMNDLFAPWAQAQQAFWKAAIYESLEVQLTAAEAWKAWICANDANIPEPMAGACQMVHFFEDWTRSQIQLWDGWFAVLERVAPGLAARPAEAAQEDAKPRVHEHARRHDAPAHAQSRNGVPV